MEKRLHLWMVWLISACSASDEVFNESPALHPRFYNLDWMKSIPDGTPVSAIAIPGTHESLTEYGGPLTQRQVWNLSVQLKAGIRYFDIHVGIWIADQQHVYVWDGWWMISQQIRMDEVLAIVFNFLELHQSETVLLNLEVHGLFRTRIFQMIKKMMSQNRDRIWTDPTVPTMGQVRGKLVFVKSSSFEGVEKTYSEFFHDNKLDYTECKIEQAKPLLCGRSILVTENPRAVLWTPKSLARTVNGEINKCVVHNRESFNQGCLGVISMNFPSAALVQNIIQLRPCRCAGEPEPTTASPQTTVQTPPPPTEPRPEEPPPCEPPPCEPDTEPTPPPTEPRPEEPPPCEPPPCEPDTEPTPPPTEPPPCEPPPCEPDTEPTPPPTEPCPEEPPPCEPDTEPTPPPAEPCPEEPPPCGPDTEPTPPPAEPRPEEPPPCGPDTEPTPPPAEPCPEEPPPCGPDKEPTPPPEPCPDEPPPCGPDIEPIPPPEPCPGEPPPCGPGTEPPPPPAEPCPDEPPPCGPDTEPTPPPEPRPEEPPPCGPDTEPTPPPEPPTFEPGSGSEPTPLTEPGLEEPPESGSGPEPIPEPVVPSSEPESTPTSPSSDGGFLLKSRQEPTWSPAGAPPGRSNNCQRG